MKAARIYAAKLGWAVVPLHDVTAGHCSCADGEECIKSAGKHPRLKAWQEECSNDPAQVDAWIAQWPGANVGIATGEVSGFFALDEDPEHGGRETLAALVAEHGELPETALAETGSGGHHYLFTFPGFDLRNSAGRLGDGLDTRGNGGQIVVAPSVSAKGRYRWIKPPWKTPIAEAPAWLLEKLRAPALRPSTPFASTESRGFFPAATEPVLNAARVTLERFGPAIDGQGGGLHTVQAAAILTHDFALTDDEALPLILEWNETCQPPWELEGRNGLRVMLGRGRKYGKAEYGCRRSLDSVEQARKLVTDWKERGAPEPEMFGMIAEARKIAERSGTSDRRAVIERDLIEATGLKSRQLALPKPKASPSDTDIPQGTIEVQPRLHETADDALKYITPLIFQRNGVLCEVATNIDRTFINELETPRIRDLMSKSAKYVRRDENGLVEQAAPLDVAAILNARRTHPKNLRVIEAVTTSPIFLADGSILQERGYNAAARVFLEPNVAVDVPEEPDQADAVAAVAVFREMLRDFAFAEPADFSSWLAALLSPLTKAATRNAPVPLVCVSASNAGSGKTLLTDLLAQIVMGTERAELSPYNSRDSAEWAKKLTAFVKMGAPLRVFDNCNGPVGDEGLDRLITSSTWSDRILGASDAPPLPNVTTWLATGNNIEPIGDTVRRVLMCRIEVSVERPQERDGFQYPLESGYALKNRAALLSSALTILRAFHVAGRPPQDLPAWGSFSTWSALVRDALVWAGAADPFVTQRRAAAQLNEGENEAHDFWLTVIDESDGFAGSIAAAANTRDAATVLSLREPITRHSLRKLVRRFIDKPRSGQKIRQVEERNQARYIVERIAKH